jgi:FMN phosphatase YigB (HAD superfamily)
VVSDRIQAVVLDLFDTLVEWSPQRLPTIEWRGQTIPSTAPWFLPRLQEMMGEGFDRDTCLAAYFGVLSEIEAERERDGVEITCLERFVRMLSRLGRWNETEVATLAGELTRVHMAGVRRVTSAPVSWAGAVRRIAPHFRLALCSNFDDSETGREILNDTGIAHLFEAVLISADIGVRKPNPKIYERILEMLALAPGEILFVGDGPYYDVAGPNRAGMGTVWVREKKGEFPADVPAPDFTIANLTELPVLLGC